MSFILKLSTFIIVCFFVFACNSGENENGSNQSTSTNSDLAPLIVPTDASQTTAPAPTISIKWQLTFKYRIRHKSYLQEDPTLATF